MRVLMISLDKEILNPRSAVAKRMIEYGKSQTIDIIIPSREKLEINLSDNIRVWGTGGNKWQQFFRVWNFGQYLSKQNKYDWVTTQDPFLTGLIGMLLRRHLTKLEIQVHGDFLVNLYYRQSGFKNWSYYWLARLITIRQADQLRVVGERVKQSLLVLGIDAQKIIVRSVPIDEMGIRTYVPNKNIKDEFPGFEKYFLYVGRLEPEKNVGWLLKTFAQYLAETKNNDGLVILGDGSQKFFLTGLVSNKNIVFRNYTVSALDYIKTADCVLIPSLSEGYGLVAMEAAAAGTKLIMTDVGVANFELKASDMVKIIPINNREEYIAALKSY